MLSPMLSPARIEEITARAAKEHLKPAALESVRSRSTFDSEGHQAVRITIVLKRDFARRVKDDDALDALVAITSALANAGEERTPIIEYAEAGEA